MAKELLEDVLGIARITILVFFSRMDSFRARVALFGRADEIQRKRVCDFVLLQAVLLGARRGLIATWQSALLMVAARLRRA